MSVWLCLISISLALVSSTPVTCSMYECKQAGQVFPLDACVQELDSIYYATPCPSGQSCLWSTGNATCTTVTPSAPNYYPGEKCASLADCIYSVSCTLGVCVGLSVNAGCTGDSQCNPGLFCNSTSSTCVPQLPIGGNCTNDLECNNNAVCDYSIFDTIGTCKAAYSVPAYGVVNSCTVNTNDACQSGYCTFSTSQSEYICLPALTTNGALPMKCTDTTGCVSSLDTPTNTTIAGYCNCGYNSYGYAYCSQFNGDNETSASMMYFRKWLSSTTVNKCNTARRASMDCMKNYWSTKDLIYYSYYQMASTFYESIQLTTNCTAEVFVTGYFSAYVNYLTYINDHDHDDNSYAAFLAIASVLIVIN